MKIADPMISCDLCGELLDPLAASCPHCKAARKPCPYCGKPFWNGADECPHCGKHKPASGTWSITDK